MTTKLLAAATLGLLLLGGCSAKPKGAADPYAGLDAAILAWKADLTTSHPACRTKAPDQKCEAFEVACKAQRIITQEEQAKGVTAKLIADMTWSGFDEKGMGQPVAATAEFSKTAGTWSRREARPVNPATCADL